ncbi:hypothetical protein GIB67_005494 [Kingdonia uniflora]|uniref:Uncharacterized protein n=1 Tax=Kingdonia uniflora TaxID=39325 RepID=A0A7J7NI37_9MAGN|nr:hypothetical protein GIB67_005494 [Kingdonia uniflora]
MIHILIAFSKVIRSWASKKFMTGCVILLPMAITFYITWCLFHFVDGFFSPIYTHLGINVFGKGVWVKKSSAALYVPTNHLYMGDIFPVNPNEILRPNLSVREGIVHGINLVFWLYCDAEIVISGGMSIPQILTTIDAQTVLAARVCRSPKFTTPQI